MRQGLFADVSNASKRASLAWNASSTRRASAAVKLFLAPRIRCAQIGGLVSRSNVLEFSKKLIAQCGSMPRRSSIGFAGCRRLLRRDGLGFVGRNSFGRRSAGHACSAPASQLPMPAASAP